MALVSDLMEPLRLRVDRFVLDFARGHTFSPGDVHLTERGVCRLHPDLARTVAGLAVDDSALQRVVAEVVRKLAGIEKDLKTSGAECSLSTEEIDA